MIIKKFQGKTEEEAVNAAKKEMGENVVVMNVKFVKKKGLFSIFYKPICEATVALEEESERNLRKTPVNKPQTIADSNAAKAITAYKEQTKDTSFDFTVGESQGIEQKLENISTLLEKSLSKEEEEKEEEFNEDSQDKSVKFLKLIYNTLIDNEVAEKYANELIETIGQINNPKSSVDIWLSNIYQKMILKFGQPVTIPLGSKSPRVIFFIGPTGVGKTTTIAKLASLLAVNHKKKVALLTTDTYRIAAAEQLKTYANILEVPFKVVYTTEEMNESVKKYSDVDYILVDTAGHSHNNEDQKDSMKSFIDCIDEELEKDVYLVLSATTKYRDLLSIADAYSKITEYKLIFTKLDETTTLGNLFNLCMHTKSSMSYVTCGQNVPDDIEVFSPQTTVKQLLGGK